MYKLVTDKQEHGPFNSIERNVEDNGWLINGGLIMHDTIAGENGVVSTWTDPKPLSEGVKASLSRRVVSLMIKKQDGGMIFNGTTIATDSMTVADLAGSKQKGRISRKVVTRGGGRHLELNQSQFDAMFDAVETHRYETMVHAHDLLELIDAATDADALTAIDTENGWPDNNS